MTGLTTRSSPSCWVSRRSRGGLALLGGQAGGAHVYRDPLAQRGDDLGDEGLHLIGLEADAGPLVVDLPLPGGEAAVSGGPELAAADDRGVAEGLADPGVADHPHPEAGGVVGVGIVLDPGHGQDRVARYGDRVPVEGDVPAALQGLEQAGHALPGDDAAELAGHGLLGVEVGLRGEQGPGPRPGLPQEGAVELLVPAHPHEHAGGGEAVAVAVRR